MPSGLLKAVLMHQLEFSRRLGDPENRNSRAFYRERIFIMESKQEEASFDIVYVVGC